MTPFGPDGAASYGWVSSVPAPTVGVVAFSESLQVFDAQGIAGGWSGGYAGHVYAQSGTGQTTPPS